MAFRAGEAASNRFDEMRSYFIPKEVRGKERNKSERTLEDIVSKYGPVVDTYPTWHPLVSQHDDHHPETIPSKACGYGGLDHTRFLANAFITCPYGDDQLVIESAEELARNCTIANIKAKRLDIQFYNSSARPVLVSCDWIKPLGSDGSIPASLAVPLMLEKELPSWRWAQFGETWETMRPYFLGRPHGSRSSLFINQKTAIEMKKIWNLLVNTGMFGPTIVSRQ